jgi:hypothetical protein
VIYILLIKFLELCVHLIKRYGGSMSCSLELLPDTLTSTPRHVASCSCRPGNRNLYSMIDLYYDNALIFFIIGYVLVAVHLSFITALLPAVSRHAPPPFVVYPHHLEKCLPKVCGTP